MGMKRLTGTRSKATPCQDTGPGEASPGARPESIKRNDTEELPAAFLVV